MRGFLLFCIWFIFTPNFALAFTVSIPGVFGYNVDDVTIHINPTNCPSSITSDTEEAIRLWNSTPSSGLHLELGTNTTSPVSSYKTFSFTDKEIVIGCSVDFNNDKNGGCDSTCLATTVAVGGTSSIGGYLAKGKIVINMNSGVAGNYDLRTPTHKRIVLAHELGHALGLGHTEDIPALMYYNISQKEYFSLSQDDLDGITYLYSRDELGDNLPFGCGTLSKVNPFTAMSLLWMLLPAALAFSLRQRYCRIAINQLVKA